MVKRAAALGWADDERKALSSDAWRVDHALETISASAFRHMRRLVDHRVRLRDCRDYFANQWHNSVHSRCVDCFLGLRWTRGAWCYVSARFRATITVHVAACLHR